MYSHAGRAPECRRSSRVPGDIRACDCGDYRLAAATSVAAVSQCTSSAVSSQIFTYAQSTLPNIINKNKNIINIILYKFNHFKFIHYLISAAHVRA